MGPYGSLWVLMCPYWSLCVFMGPYRSLCVLMRPCGSLWDNKSSYAFSWILVDPYGSL